MRQLTTLFPSEFLEEHAEELGVVERDRKLQIPAFLWAFVFGFAAGESRTLAGFRHYYNSTADETISPNGFYQRLTPTLAEYLRDLVEAALDEVAVPNAVDADLDRFRDVMIADGTVLRLHEFLSDQFEARHEEQAGALIHRARQGVSRSRVHKRTVSVPSTKPAARPNCSTENTPSGDSVLESYRVQELSKYMLFYALIFHIFACEDLPK